MHNASGPFSAPPDGKAWRASPKEEWDGGADAHPSCDSPVTVEINSVPHERSLWCSSSRLRRSSLRLDILIRQPVLDHVQGTTCISWLEVAPLPRIDSIPQSYGMPGFGVVVFGMISLYFLIQLRLFPLARIWREPTGGCSQLIGRGPDASRCDPTPVESAPRSGTRAATSSCSRGRPWHRQSAATPTPRRPATPPARRPTGRSKSLSVSPACAPPSLSPQLFARPVAPLSFACRIPPRFTHPLFPAPHTAPWPPSSLAVSLLRRSAVGGGRRCAPPAGRRRRGHGWRPAALSLMLAARSSCRWSSIRRARPTRLSLLTTRRRGAARARYVLLGSFWLRRVYRTRWGWVSSCPHVVVAGTNPFSCPCCVWGAFLPSPACTVDGEIGVLPWYPPSLSRVLTGSPCPALPIPLPGPTAPRSRSPPPHYAGGRPQV